MFKLSFALLIGVTLGAPAGGKHAKGLVHESEFLMSDSACPTANEQVCSGNGKCYAGNEECLTLGDGSASNFCECVCDPGWTGWDCFTVDTCTADMEVTMDYDGVYYDFYKANMLNQIKYYLTATPDTDCAYGAWTFKNGVEDGWKTETFEVKGYFTSGDKAGQETPWSSYSEGSCGFMKREVGTLNVKVGFFNKNAKQNKGFLTTGDVEGHQMKLAGGKCKIFSWRGKQISESTAASTAMKDDLRAVWETNGESPEVKA